MNAMNEQTTYRTIDQPVPPDPDGREDRRGRWVPSRELTASLVVEFLCPACGRRVRTQRQNVGRPGRCPACGLVSLVPRRPRRTYLHW